MSGARIPEACRNLVRRARTAGWTIEHLARRLRWISPDGAVVIASCSPGGRRSVENESARTPG
jgi:hypothetical protein